MSRIGRKPVTVPSGVKVSVNATSRTVGLEGPKGKLERAQHPAVEIAYDEAGRKLLVRQRELPGASLRQQRQARAMWGTMRRLLDGMIEGVTKGYTKQLQVVGVGYSARIDKADLCIRAGVANEFRVPIPAGIKVDSPEVGNLMITGIGQVPATTITCHGIDKQQIGQFAVSLRRLRPPEPYKGKGIRYLGEEVKRKAGKALATGAK